MKRCAMAIVVCASVLLPSSARADDGGWLDWLFRMDPKFAGGGTEFHVICLNRQNQIMRNCEEFFWLPRLLHHEGGPVIEYNEIQHEVNLRVAYYRTYGDLYAANPKGTANALKLMAFYNYHPDQRIVVGLGAGVMPFYGADLSSTRWGGVFTPLSVRYAPATSGPEYVKAFFLQFEATWIGSVPSPDLFTNMPPPAAFAPHGEWNISFSQGFDFRRRTAK